MTGSQIQKLIKQKTDLTITASRLYGTAYGVGIQLGPDDYAGPVLVPGSNDPLKFDSLDEVTTFLAQIGVERFQVVI